MVLPDAARKFPTFPLYGYQSVETYLLEMFSFPW